MSNDPRIQLPHDSASGTSGAPGDPGVYAGSRAKRDELALLVNSRTPIITVETTEEERLESLLLAVATQLRVPFYSWTVTSGLRRVPGEPIYSSDQPEQALTNIAQVNGDAIFLLKDFARYCESDKISRRLRDLADQFRTGRRAIVLSSPSMNLPREIECESSRFDLGLPSAEELAAGVTRVLAEIRSGQANHLQQNAAPLTRALIEQLARNLVGLTLDEAMRTLRKSALTTENSGEELLSGILKEKYEALRADGLLEPVARDVSFADVIGLKHLREWFEKRRSAFTPEGRSFGLVPPKGILITGVQGCGKSLASRAIAVEWGVEVARFDPGAIYDKFMGESEKRLRRAFDLAERLSPMVLWIDEIEKGFASAGTSGDADAGLSQRLLATFLTWMQERQSGVFLVATSNNVSGLPPEMIRKGRFDEIFFVDLPEAMARAGLFRLHLTKHGRDANGFDLPTLAGATEGYSGAEIEQVILSGMYTAFGKKQPLTTEILLAEIRETQPLSVTRAADVQAIRDWAKSRAVPAD